MYHLMSFSAKIYEGNFVIFRQTLPTFLLLKDSRSSYQRCLSMTSQPAGLNWQHGLRYNLKAIYIFSLHPLVKFTCYGLIFIETIGSTIMFTCFGVKMLICSFYSHLNLILKMTFRLTVTLLLKTCTL